MKENKEILKFKTVKKVLVSKNFIVLLTGKSAIILNKKFEILHKENKLDYVYNGIISPDQKKLLLVSNANMFYLFDLIHFSLIKKVICKGEFNDNLEGCGLWHFDNQHILIPVQHSTELISRIRCYDISNDYSYTEYRLNDIYHIISCCSSPNHQTHYFAAYNNSTENNDLYIIIVNNEKISYIPLTSIEDVIMEINYIEKFNLISIIGQDDIHFVNLNDFTINSCEEIKHQLNISNFSNSFCKIVFSNYNPYIFYSSLNSVYIVETNTREVIYSKTFNDDIWDITEISRESFAISFINTTHIITLGQEE